MSGVAAISVESSWSRPAKAESKSRAKVCPGGWCVASSTSAIRPKATSSEPAGTTTFSQRG